MKRILPFFLAGCMLLVLNACSLPWESTPASLDATTEAIATTETTSVLETSSVKETIQETEAPPQVTVSTPETEATLPPEEDFLSVKICRDDFPIYNGPSYDNRQVGIVGAVGIYTIVETIEDYEGNSWGKLKSGAGWVDLSLNEKETLNMPPVTVAPADEALLASENYHYCKADTSQYALDVAFRAHAVLTDVSFFAIDPGEFRRGPELFHLSTWDPSVPFVASISFPGDASLFGLEFTDGSGVTQIYAVSESGRNGSLCISPLTATLLPAYPAPDPAIPDSLDMYFSSGAGAWGTELILYGDGSFSGAFHDSNMGETGEGYPHGTCYICDFSGIFQVTGTDTYVVNLSLMALTVKDYGATEWIEDKIRYIVDSPYGISGGSNFLLFMPNTPVAELPEDIANWWHGAIPETGTLGCYALYCVETGLAFLGY